MPGAKGLGADIAAQKSMSADPSRRAGVGEPGRHAHSADVDEEERPARGGVGVLPDRRVHHGAHCIHDRHEGCRGQQEQQPCGGEGGGGVRWAPVPWVGTSTSGRVSLAAIQWPLLQLPVPLWMLQLVSSLLLPQLPGPLSLPPAATHSSRARA